MWQDKNCRHSVRSRKYLFGSMSEVLSNNVSMVYAPQSQVLQHANCLPYSTTEGWPILLILTS